MWDLAVREDDYQAVDGMLRRFSGAPLSYRVVPAYARGDSAARGAHARVSRLGLVSPPGLKKPAFTSL